MSCSQRTGLSLNMAAHKQGTPQIGPAVPWRCRRCRVAVSAGETWCEPCLELHLDWKRDAAREDDARESDTEIVL